MKASTNKQINKYRGLVLVVWVFLGLFPEFINAQSCGFQTTCVPPSDWANGSWQMFNGTQNHTGRQAMKGNFTSGRYVKWSYITPEWIRSSPAIGDINNDGQIEIVVGDDYGYISALRGTDGFLLWNYNTRPLGRIYSSPSIGDINRDGQVEVVVGNGDNAVYALRGTDGSLLWLYGTWDRVYSSPAIGDIDNDGQIEVVVGSRDSRIYAFRGTNGTILWFFTTGSSIHSSPAIGDINNDGQIEVVIGSLDNRLYALRGTNGSLLWSYTTDSMIYSSPAIGDINGDGNIEVVIGSLDNKVYALRGTNGSLLWSYTTLAGVYSSPTIGDINNDGNVEVAVGSWDGYIHVLRGTNGSLVWSYNVLSSYTLYEDIVLADIDPSPGIEIITHGRGRSIYVLSSSGTLLWQDGGDQWSVSVGDVDGDGCVEIVAVGNAISIMVIDATSNEGGCGILGNDDELSVDESKVLKPDDYVKIFTTDGRRIYRGEYKSFKPERRGIYFVVAEGGKVKKVVR